MMNQQQPDKFFRDKLEGYHRPAPIGAWNRVSSNLKKRSRTPWLRVAASILIVVAAGIALSPFLTKEQAGPIAEQRDLSAKDPETGKTDIDKNNSARLNDAKRPAAPEPIEKSIPEESAGKGKQKPLKKNEATRVRPTLPDTTVAISENLVAAHEENGEVEPVKNETAENAPVTPATQAKTKTVTIVFTAQEVNEKYLTKKINTDATPDEKGSSGLRKLLDKANDLTTNQDLLGNLRYKKNEILAMNFKSDKERTEND